MSTVHLRIRQRTHNKFRHFVLCTILYRIVSSWSLDKYKRFQRFVKLNKSETTNDQQTTHKP